MKVGQEVKDLLVTTLVTALTSILMKFGRKLRGKSNDSNIVKQPRP